MKRIITIVSLPLIAALAGCHASDPPAPPETPVSAKTVVIGSALSDQTVSITGVVKPRFEVDLSAQIVAPVTTVSKREGDQFRKGELLVRLSAPALNAAVTQGNAALQSAQKQEDAAAAQASLAADTLGRYAQLREHHSVTPFELEQVRSQSAAAIAQQQSAAAQVSVARAATAAQRANAADASLYAPFDGVVTRRMIDPGAMAAPGSPLLHLQSLGQADVEFAAPDTLSESLRVGTTIPASNGTNAVTATVTNVSPAADSTTHSFLVKADLPRSVAWSVGSVVQVQLHSSSPVRTLAIPRRAIVQQGGLDAVLVVDGDNRATVRYITLGPTVGDFVQILTGLQSGDRILATGNLALAGKKIEVRP